MHDRLAFVIAVGRCLRADVCLISFIKRRRFRCPGTYICRRTKRREADTVPESGNESLKLHHRSMQVVILLRGIDLSREWRLGQLGLSVPYPRGPRVPSRFNNSIKLRRWSGNAKAPIFYGNYYNFIFIRSFCRTRSAVIKPRRFNTRSMSVRFFECDLNCK